MTLLLLTGGDSVRHNLNHVLPTCGAFFMVEYLSKDFFFSSQFCLLVLTCGHSHEHLNCWRVFFNSVFVLLAVINSISDNRDGGLGLYDYDSRHNRVVNLTVLTLPWLISDRNTTISNFIHQYKTHKLEGMWMCPLAYLLNELRAWLHVRTSVVNFESFRAIKKVSVIILEARSLWLSSFNWFKMWKNWV